MEQLLFQVIDISSDDIPVDESNYWDKEFIITFYGKTIDGKKRDDLQSAMKLIEDLKIGIPVQFINFRD